jgi:hypothetical protein
MAEREQTTALAQQQTAREAALTKTAEAQAAVAPQVEQQSLQRGQQELQIGGAQLTATQRAKKMAELDIYRNGAENLSYLPDNEIHAGLDALRKQTANINPAYVNDLPSPGTPVSQIRQWANVATNHIAKAQGNLKAQQARELQEMKGTQGEVVAAIKAGYVPTGSATQPGSVPIAGIPGAPPDAAQPAGIPGQPASSAQPPGVPVQPSITIGGQQFVKSADSKPSDIEKAEAGAAGKANVAFKTSTVQDAYNVIPLKNDLDDIQASLSQFRTGPTGPLTQFIRGEGQGLRKSLNQYALDYFNQFKHVGRGGNLLLNMILASKPSVWMDPKAIQNIINTAQLYNGRIQQRAAFIDKMWHAGVHDEASLVRSWNSYDRANPLIDDKTNEVQPWNYGRWENVMTPENIQRIKDGKNIINPPPKIYKNRFGNVYTKEGFYRSSKDKNQDMSYMDISREWNKKHGGEE